MKTPSNHIFYRTTTNLIHPAVLGTVFVNVILFFVAGKLFEHGPFPLLATFLLIWYFIVDFWVITIEFEENPSAYGPKHFFIDIAILGFLLGSFYFLWIVRSDVWFFVTLSFQIIGIIDWNAISPGGLTSSQDSYTVHLIICWIISIIAAVTAAFAPINVQSVARYIFLIFFIGYLLIYTIDILNDKE